MYMYITHNTLQLHADCMCYYHGHKRQTKQKYAHIRVSQPSPYNNYGAVNDLSTVITQYSSTVYTSKLKVLQIIMWNIGMA